MGQGKVIGGLFPLLPLQDNQVCENLIDQWTRHAEAVFRFHNARSALHHVLTNLNHQICWFPSFLCPDILDAAEVDGLKLRYYPITETLEPDEAYLDSHLSAGDLILTINYFGRCATERVQKFLANIDDVTWVEDCAQSLATKTAQSSDFQIYSPRKLLGVPDGGLLVDRVGVLPAPELRALTNLDFAEAAKLRAKDPQDVQQASWYKLFQASEKRQTVSSLDMSELTIDRLSSASIAELAPARIQNYNFLLNHLSKWCAFSEANCDWVPMCFPFKTDDAEGLCQHLYRRRIYPPTYWRLDEENALKMDDGVGQIKPIVGLPCDHRYDTEDMERMVEHVLEFMS